MRLILVELNEINFDLVKYYLKNKISLPGFKKLIDQGIIETYAESEYKNLEPWIQWPSVHTGKKYNEHKVFRLGDFINSNEEQFFEKVEKAGYKVGAISPMNASNKLLNPSYFIPDPWTKTNSDSSFFSRIITKAISQAVNDNSQSKIKLSTVFNLSLAFIFLVHPGKYFSMIKYAWSALRSPWKKALFLDKFLFEIHKTLFKKSDVNFSTIFLNAGAHIQHHYFFNSPYVDSSKLKNPSWYISEEIDPILEMLKVYDVFIDDLLIIPDTEIIISTGLSQKPYDKVKFYYRLRDHNAFLKSLEIVFKRVTPRMTRDFLIEFNSIENALIAQEILESILVNNKEPLFGEVDNRGKELFVVLTHPDEINESCFITFRNKKMPLKYLVSFVAIKNGEHQSKGYGYFSKGIKNIAPDTNSHVSKIHNSVLDFFEINS